MSDLPARLRANAECGVITAPKELLIAAADRIEALAAEVERERLRSDRIRSHMESFHVIATRVTKERDAAKRALAEAVEIMGPFAAYLDQAAFDLDNNGNPLPDERGMGWVYLTVGHFRAARDFITAQEKEKGK